jgi:hypothetical protein
VLQTLRFLHRTKRLYQFQLKGHQIRRKQHELAENTARRTIRGLNLRIQRELDAHPEIARYSGEDWQD